MIKEKTDILNIFCDEAGHTGSHLLDKNQRYYAFSSVSVSDNEAFKIIEKARKDYPVQMPELKARQLLRTSNGRALIAQILRSIDGRYAVNVMDKLLALCGKIFEYIYEPVLQNNPKIVYEKNLHRFVAMYCYIFFRTDNNAEAAIRQFEQFMRSLDPSTAPFLFSPFSNEQKIEMSENPFSLIPKFAYGYKDIIISDNKRIRTETADSGKWILDLGFGCLWSHLNHWGKTKKPLLVTCDDSNPISTQANELKGDLSDPGIFRSVKILGAEENDFGWDFVEPVKFGDSRSHPSIQLADIVASCAVWCLSNNVTDYKDLGDVVESIDAHMLRDSILPDQEVIEHGTRQADVNWLVLFDLADKAEKGMSPIADLEDLYRIAEISWVNGDYKPLKSKN